MLLDLRGFWPPRRLGGLRRVIGRDLVATDLLMPPWATVGGATIRTDGTMLGRTVWLIEDAVPSYGAIVASGLDIAAADATREIVASIRLAKNPGPTSMFAFRGNVGGQNGGMVVNPADGALAHTSYWTSNVTRRTVLDMGDHWLIMLGIGVPASQAITMLSIYPAHFGIPGGDSGAATGSHRIFDFRLRDVLP